MTGPREEPSTRSLARAAELVSARHELEQLRQIRDELANRADELAKELEAANEATRWFVAAESGARCGTCGQDIRRGEAYTVPPDWNALAHVYCPDGDRPQSDVLRSYDAWQCEHCDVSYRTAITHVCGPLTPVTVTIIHRFEGAPSA